MKAYLPLKHNLEELSMTSALMLELITMVNLVMLRDRFGFGVAESTRRVNGFCALRSLHPSIVNLY